jgi:hypothetical protein
MQMFLYCFSIDIYFPQLNKNFQYIIVCYPELYMIKFIQLVYSNPIVKLNLSATPLQILGWHQVMGDK